MFLPDPPLTQKGSDASTSEPFAHRPIAATRMIASRRGKGGMPSVGRMKGRSIVKDNNAERGENDALFLF